ncbi:hypothetical protein [Cerasicoccus fimbriatus]|uniref:hypothetical protein n=1 Tax=Cerasicoccus fimbriatus TaxID=3014554 RepID=UPI0022B52262|nr:hypothetical protein [Cerasicoccus sp. TK19100]
MVKKHSLALIFFIVSLLRSRADYEYLGPVETIDNDVVSLQVALEVGRIVSFKQHNEPDWIVVFDIESIPSWHWHPWGGDRIWPTAQHLNPQIYGNTGFDPVIDGEPWELIAKTDTSLTMRSGISPELGLQITHHIELLEDSAKVLHTYWLDRVAESPYPVHVWTITGVGEGDYILLDSDERIAHAKKKPYRRWPAKFPEAPIASLIPDSRVLMFSVANDTEQKIGTYGNWIAMVRDRQAFCQSIEFDPNELYLELSNLQSYLKRESETFEIETISPTWALPKGQKQEWKVLWELIDLPASAVEVDAIALFLSDRYDHR